MERKNERNDSLACPSLTASPRKAKNPFRLVGVFVCPGTLNRLRFKWFYFCNMGQSLIIGIFSLLILLILAAGFGFAHLRALQRSAMDFWEHLLKKTRWRMDMLPLLLEIVRSFKVVDEGVIAEMIILRQKCWPLHQPIAEKVNLELSLSQNLHIIWQAAQKNADVNRDVNFLALKKNITGLGHDIEELLELYNNKVRAYNKLVSMIFFIKKMPVLEFEA